ncbi:MAG: hypothetical protein HGA85_07530 [Nanoarchaeota archaeon]|nr:hypothetical protein [Nanoarchaeota archaeon]
MNILLIFIWVYAAMISASFWEAYSEGRNCWDKGKIGWKLKLGKYTFTGYHFFLFFMMFPILLSLPLVIYGWDTRLFGILLSAYLTGLVVEDFFWFIVNPAIRFKEDFSPKFASYYPWIKIWRINIPSGYPLLVFFAFLSWAFLWR